MRLITTNEDFTSIQKAQAGLTKVFKKAERDGKFVRVMRNNAPVGFLVPTNVWESFMEDLEAMSSESYLRRIAKSRADKKTYTMEEVKKRLGI